MFLPNYQCAKLSLIFFLREFLVTMSFAKMMSNPPIQRCGGWFTVLRVAMSGVRDFLGLGMKIGLGG